MTRSGVRFPSAPPVPPRMPKFSKNPGNPSFPLPAVALNCYTKAMDLVGKPTSLSRRKGSSAWYYRRRLPTHLCGIAGRREFVVSLRTSDYQQALMRLPDAEREYLALIEALSASGDQGLTGIRSTVPEEPKPDRAKPKFSAQQAAPLAKSYFQWALAELDRAPLAFPNHQARIDEVHELELDLGMWQDSDSSYVLRRIARITSQLLIRRGLGGAKDPEAAALLWNYLYRAERQIMILRWERAKGNFRDEISDTMFAATRFNGQPEIGPPQEISFSRVLEEYRQEYLTRNEVTPKSKLKTEAALRIIERFFGASTAIGTIDRSRSDAFRNTLETLPPNFTKRFADTMALEDIAGAHAQSGSTATLAADTQSYYLRCLANIGSFATLKGYAADESVYRPRLRTKRKPLHQRRNAFSNCQLNAIFTAVPFEQPWQAQPENGSASMFWVPLIALFSGMRMNEILQLGPANCRQLADETPYFELTTSMRLKTAAAVRIVPIHPELLAIGISDFIQEQAQRGAELLFDDVSVGSDGYRSSTFSKRFKHWLTSLRIEEPGRHVTFHSFRHNFRDALRLPDINRDIIDELGGWSRGKETSTGYGDGSRLKALADVIGKVRYDVDLSHLMIEHLPPGDA